MEKFKAYITVLILLISVNSISAQVKSLEEYNIIDEYFINEGIRDIDDFYGDKGETEIGDFRFEGVNDINTLLYNNYLLERARSRALRRWYNRQKKLAKTAIERKHSEKFNNYEEAKNYEFLDVEKNNKRNFTASLKRKYNGTIRRQKSIENNHVKNLKYLKLRKREIQNKSGCLYPEVKINNVSLKNINSVNKVNDFFDSEVNKMYNNSSALIKNVYTLSKLNNLDEGFDRHLLNAKNKYFNRFDIWDQMNMMQVLINYYPVGPIQLPPELVKFNEIIGTVDHDFIRNYAQDNREIKRNYFDRKYRLWSELPTNPTGHQIIQNQAKIEELKRETLETMMNNIPININKQTDFVVEYLRINNSEVVNWLNNNPNEGIKLHNKFHNILSSAGQIVANDIFKNSIYPQIELEAKYDKGKIKLKPQSGKINNRDDQRYTHFASNGIYNFYKLEDGSKLISSPSPLSLNKNGKLVNRFTSETSSEEYWYIKLEGTDTWNSYLLKGHNSKVDELELLFRLGAMELAESIGRYVLPVEDIKIIIDGKDFDGQAVSRYKAAGFLLLTFVPGSKALKLVKFIPSNATKWAVTTLKANGKTSDLYFKVVNGVVIFGSRSKLAKIIGTTIGQEAHHIIPWADVIRNNPIVQKAARAGFHMNSKVNGIALQKYSRLIGEGLHGYHPAYNKFVQKRFQEFIKRKPNFNNEQAKDFLEKNLIPELLNKIELAKKSGLSLNEYFKRFI